MSIRYRLLLLVILIPGLRSGVAAAQIPDHFTNLRVLPETISRDSLIEVMKGFSFSLGVPCKYCHVGGDDDPRNLRGVEFAKDDDPDKRKARFMLRMLDSLNRSVLAALPDRDVPAVRMTCKTCHRGEAKPLLLTQEMALGYDSGGVDAAIARYRALRERRGMSGAFDFGEWEVNTWADGLARQGRVADALAIYELNHQYFPRSAAITRSIAVLAERLADTTKAVRFWKALLELVPDDPAAARNLARIQQASAQPPPGKGPGAR